MNKGRLANTSANISRRQVLKWAGAGAGALTLGAGARALAQRDVDVHIQLFARPSSVQLLAGNTTDVLRFSARLLKGPKGTLVTMGPNSYLGPTICLRKGQRVRIDFYNQMPDEDCVVHYHGLHVPHLADGHPVNVVFYGDHWAHEFTVLNDAGTYWYHAHTDGRTSYQVGKGLAGFLIVRDAVEDRIRLPRGSRDIPIMIQDRRFTASNQIFHTFGSTTGQLGDKICINGAYNSTLNMESTGNRLRLLNGSSSRIYKLAWSNGTPMTVIGTDGGLLATPLNKPYVMLAPGQRRDIFIDGGDFANGTQFKLVSQTFEKGGAGSGSPPQGTAMDLLNVTIVPASSDEIGLPSTLRPYTVWNANNAVNFGNPRTFGLEFVGLWTINGNFFDIEGYTPDEVVQLNQLEQWEIRNDLETSFEQPHPMHFHGPQFQISNRVCTNPGTFYNTVKDGYVDVGWHDTILAFPYERVEFLTRWTDFTGLFLYHCHNLDHEDMGMMRNLYVTA